MAKSKKVYQKPFGNSSTHPNYQGNEVKNRTIIYKSSISENVSCVYLVMMFWSNYNNIIYLYIKKVG